MENFPPKPSKVVPTHILLDSFRTHAGAAQVNDQAKLSRVPATVPSKGNRRSQNCRK
jgi:hypothetical protein